MKKELSVTDRITQFCNFKIQFLRTLYRGSLLLADSLFTDLLLTDFSKVLVPRFSRSIFDTHGFFRESLLLSTFSICAPSELRDGHAQLRLNF